MELQFLNKLCTISIIFTFVWHNSFLGIKLEGVDAHARLLEPPGRSSIWRYPEFKEYDPVVNVNDNEIFCGGLGIMQSQNGGKCGLCGDRYDQARPRDNEANGKYDIGLIVRNYTKGSIIETTIEMTANHRGYFEFTICARNNRSQMEEEECFEKWPLKQVEKPGSRIYPVYIDQSNGKHTNYLQLPKDLTCTDCVLRWDYVTANQWGWCGNETKTAEENKLLGCGPSEVFRSCADVSIQ